MGIHLEGIHFLVTYRCTYACDHCFVWGSPDAEGTMTLAQLTSAIDQAAECGVETVYFEGGEPTLAYPIVLAAAAHARRRGLEWGMVSNCFWATSVEDAKVWLAPFVDLGISDLSLSSYAYFVEDADEDRLRNAALATQELGLPMAVLEVGAAACLDVPGLCLGEDVGEIMCKGRAAVELAPGRADRPPETLSPAPSRTSPSRAELTSAATVSCRSARASAPATCSPMVWPPCSRATTRRGGRSSPRSRPAAPGPWHRRTGTSCSARSTPTSAISATKCARPFASAFPRYSRRLSATASRPSRPPARPKTNQRRRRDHALGVRTVLGARHVCGRRS